MCHNPQPIPTGMYLVLSISSSPPFLWMTTFQQHNIPQKCWYTPGSLYCVTVQIIIMKTQNVIWIFNMTLNMCLHNLRVHLYEQWKGYRTLQQRIPRLRVHQFWYSAKHMTAENCALVGCYIANIGNSLPTFQDNLSMVKLPRVGPWISTGLLTPFSPVYPGFTCGICTMQ